MMSEQRFFVDNNILVSRLLAPNSIPAQALRVAVEKGKLLISADTLRELSVVLSRKKFDKYVSLENRQEFIQRLGVISELILIQTRITICRDPRDNKFLELAVDGKAQIIITGDQDLLILNPFENIDVLTPRDFLLRYDV
ncbi:MAG: putative toxin-antitoxin system toxin component, PIN family [Woronichinia naegeliana WA131]|jgi:putative PIN family toxin of toxin-antitoxin system|uniref:Toxin-antitoxin system toxin component, PIN family n=1 Tax=Woronichinia naegeliana WA131 TaxID=2824559 RepID=A0A977KZE0_9CYAN|nr:MAG: putative toxin-antitoxin system toxin component, PIN family [Woronichinia naegeliana WA131]